MLETIFKIDFNFTNNLFFPVVVECNDDIDILIIQQTTKIHHSVYHWCRSQNERVCITITLYNTTELTPVHTC